MKKILSINSGLLLLILLHVFVVLPESLAQTQIEQLSQTETPAKDLVRVVLRVLTKGNGRPLTRVEVKSGANVAFTDPKGEAVLMIPAGATGRLEIARAGYETTQIAIADLLKQPIYTLYLLPATPDDNEVIVRGMRRPEVSRKTISVSESARIADGGDPVQVTKLMPGVQTQMFSPDIVVRGSGPSDSRYFIDAFEVPDIFHRIGNISVLPDQLTSDVEFSSGGFGPQYGNATGGIVVLRTKSEIPEVAKTEFRVNLPTYSTLYHERPLSDDSSIAVSIRKSYLDYFLPAVMPKDAGLTVVPAFADVHAFGVKRVDDGYYKVLAMGSMDGLKLVAPIDAATSEDGRGNIDIFTGFATFGVERMRRLSDAWSYTISPQVLYQKMDMTLLDNKLQWHGWQTSAHTEFRNRRSGNESTYVGIQPTYATVESFVEAPIPQSDPFADFEEAPKQKSSRKYTFSDISAWIGHDQQLGDFILTPGVRVFYYDQISKTSVDPRFNLRYMVSKETSVKAAVGQYSRAPEVVEASPDFGNPDLDYEKSFHYVLGVETAWSDKWTTDVQVFAKRTIDVIVGDSAKHFVNSGSVISRGLEVFVRRNMTERFFGWLSYTYSKTQERDSDQESLRPAQYDQTHVATVAGSYRLTATWDLGLRVGYHTGDTYTPIRDAVYNADLDKYQPRADDAALYSARNPDFHQIDIFANKDFLFNTWKLALRFGVQYLALESQAFAVQYNYDYSKEEAVAGIPPIPYIELRGEL